MVRAKSQHPMSKHLVMQMYAVLLTLFGVCLIYDHMMVALMYPTGVILGEFNKAYGFRGLFLGIVGILAALLLTYGIRHL